MFDSPLRYPGGKGRLAQYVIDLLELNNLTGGHYVEPYAGGAGVAIALLYLEYASHVHLNDLNRSIYAFWTSVLRQPDALCQMVVDAPLNVDEWRKQKTFQAALDIDHLTLGFSTLYLNRTNVSGILKGGLIGGVGQGGPWKMDARFNKKEIVRRIQKIARFAPRITLCNLDAIEFIITKVGNLPTAKTLVYLDPPYYSNGRRLYETSYKSQDHVAVCQAVIALRHPWIVSYDAADAIKSMYGSYRQQAFDLLYSARGHYKGSEVMIFSDTLNIPGSVTPWRGIAA